MRWAPLILVGLLLAACGADEPTFDAVADRAAFGKAREIAREMAAERAEAEAEWAVPPSGEFAGMIEPVEPAESILPVAGDFARYATLKVDAAIVAGRKHDRVRVDIYNLASLPVRIPGDALSLEVRPEGSPASYFIKERTPAFFTIYYESIIEVEAQGRTTIWIDAYMGYYWTVPRECRTLSGAVEYRARLYAEPGEYLRSRRWSPATRAAHGASHTPRANGCRITRHTRCSRSGSALCQPGAKRRGSS